MFNSRKAKVHAFISLLLITTVVQSTTTSQQLFQHNNARLFEDIFTGYHREMSPYNGHGLLNDSYPINPVKITLQYARLIRVMEPELQHQNLVGVFVNWQDPRLSWNSADYGGIDHIYVNRLAVWMPEFYPCESSQVSIVSSEHSLSIGLNSSGFMNIFLIFSALYSCEFDVYRFPFEDCYYCFLISNYDARDELRLDPQFSQRPFIYDTTEWELKLRGAFQIDSLDNDFNMGVLYYNISFIRRPQFWVGLVITPTYLIGSLIIIGLFFGKGENIENNAVGLGLTTMMSMMVIVGILANSIAKSQYIPILGWYVIAEIIIITMAVFALMTSEVWCGYFISLFRTRATDKDSGVKKSNANVWIFSLFFAAHTINLIILFRM